MEENERTITLPLDLVDDLFGMAAAYQDATSGSVDLETSQAMLGLVGVGFKHREEVLTKVALELFPMLLRSTE